MLQRQPAFVGRVHELAVLQDVAERDSGALVLVSGRRRIGKTYLLQHFIHNRRAIFYQATRQAPNVELTAFTREVERALGTFPPGYSYPTWDAAFDDLTARCDEKRLVVVLDEFSYLCDSSPGMPSIVQRWWDLRGRNSSIMLVLCGSSQSFMADLDTGSAPLHQRFTAKIRLGPLTFREAALFVPTLTPADRARVYGVLGGTPLYLREWNAARPVRENLIRLFGDPAGLLVDSARLVLHTDLGDATAAYRALSAVAAGATRRNDILQKANITNERVLHRLEELSVLTRRVPVTEGNASRRGVFAVTDPYFRFWFRFIEPHQAAIYRGFGERLIDDVLREGLETHMGSVFEDMARTFAAELVHAGELEALDVGAWWSTDGDHEIDVVGVRRTKVTFIGSVKWRAAPLGRDVYRNLLRHAKALNVDESIPWLLIGCGGAEPTLLEREPHVRAYDIDDLYAPRHRNR